MLDDGHDASLIVAKDGDYIVYDVVVLAEGVATHLYARVSEEFFRTNESTLHRVGRSIRVANQP